jgi:DHA2 family multidrug resistance protein-like MFS transporter
MEQPMLDMRLFARGTFSGALLVNLLSVVALVGFLFFVAQHLQLIVGLSPMEAGFALVPGMVAMIVAGSSSCRSRARMPASSCRRARVLGRRVPARGAVGDRRPRLLSPPSSCSASASVPPRRCRTSSSSRRTAGEGRGRQRRVGDGVRAGRRPRHRRARRHPDLPLRTGMTLPRRHRGAADAARETLAGAMAVAEQLDARRPGAPRRGARLRLGVVVTSRGRGPRRRSGCDRGRYAENEATRGERCRASSAWP